MLITNTAEKAFDTIQHVFIILKTASKWSINVKVLNLVIHLSVSCKKECSLSLTLFNIVPKKKKMQEKETKVTKNLKENKTVIIHTD